MPLFLLITEEGVFFMSGQSKEIYPFFWGGYVKIWKHFWMSLSFPITKRLSPSWKQ